MKTSKKYLAILLTLCTLLCSIVSYSIYAVTVEEETPVSADADMGNEEELMPMAAQACSYIHYVVNGYHSNNYVKSVTVTTYYNGKIIDTYTVDYPESGDESMPKFHGCKCPMCN